ncbi:MAG: intein-containing adenosylcobalamin-dependent ribonucleoside-diphosphate reductase [Nanoarchaeota archaeon]|nr:intein-containing adenosylcobalamin-dependent ribonucleoside-diphosphate reductase [Nanoarchaeota archaeon]
MNPEDEGLVLTSSMIVGSGLKINNYFSHKGVFENVEWEKRDAQISDERGGVLFIQKDISVPSFWSQLATQIVVSRYFYGEIGKEEREKSIQQLIERVSNKITNWGLKDRYFDVENAEKFKNEVNWLTLNQHMAFNSPTWFNVGVDTITEGKNEKKDGFIIHDGSVIDLPIGGEYKYPQTSACFIQGVDDTMESIMQLAINEAILFKHGSGTGSDLSTLRSSREKLSGGGKPSGPLAYLMFYDRVAGIVKSGGKTRRAAKMDSLRVDHPDILEFIKAKSREEEKIHLLMDNCDLDGVEATDTVAFQNANLSVRATDGFMNAVIQDEDWKTIPVKCEEMKDEMPRYKARELMEKIAKGTFDCGDPGMQFHDTINKWHTCPNSAPINASNPCVTGDTKVLTKEGRWIRIDKLLDNETTILTNMGNIVESQIVGSFETGIKQVYKLETKSGYEIKLTGDHKVFTINRGFVLACELTKDDFVLLPKTEVAEISEIENKEFYQMIGFYLGDGCGGKINNQRGIQLTMHKENESSILNKFANYVAENYERMTHKNSPATVQITNTSGKYSITNNTVINKLSEYVDLKLKSHEKCLSESIFGLNLGEQKYVLQGLFTADGTVANYGEKSQYISLDSTSLRLLKDVQILLSGFGIKSKIYKNRRAGKEVSLLPDGKGGLKEYKVREIHSLRVSRNGRIKFQKLIGFMPESYKNEKLKIMNTNVSFYEDKPIDSVSSLKYLGEEKVYDLTEPISHSFVANGITVHNCSEYMFVNDSACNLASLNLLRFMEKDDFDVDKFGNAVRITAIAQDLEIDNSSYPTAKIAENSNRFRPLGMGFSNLGALLMDLGLPYDSDEGRAVAAVISALMTAKVYETSTEMAENIGTFEEFEKNKEPMMNVIKKHRDALSGIDIDKLPYNFINVYNAAVETWETVVERGEKFGFRNAQATVLAPTGTIGFMMDCDTLGIEPDIGLVKTKLLAEGGTLKIVNQTVKHALKKLGYDEKEIKDITDYVLENSCVEGCGIVKEEHLGIFDCAISCGERVIIPHGHLKMMAAVQPFLSGAISKTVNLPNQVTEQEVFDLYVEAWKMGLKAVAMYRDGSKRRQPLTVGKQKLVTKSVMGGPVRKKMPLERKAVIHKFNIGGHEGYLTVGLYDDGGVGEFFINMSKEGSTIGGLMDTVGVLASRSLQYGVPLREIIMQFKRQRFDPLGIVLEGHPEIKTALSIIDYIGNYLEKTFIDSDLYRQPSVVANAFEPPEVGEVNKDKKNLGASSPQSAGAASSKYHETANSREEKGGFCAVCGVRLIKKGSCKEICPECDWVSPNGCGE